ncbi:Solute carrier family 35 member C2 [Trichinella papuae]|uniref:Solute carrier family 35 member C2 n=1 Tax=Trichinella papuae TaxID=268474 RepID=A0A0V1MJI9_9BILA|nr:Solute carrier family 35 member C2 [Trichinella papuae]
MLFGKIPLHKAKRNFRISNSPVAVEVVLFLLWDVAVQATVQQSTVAAVAVAGLSLQQYPTVDVTTVPVLSSSWPNSTTGCPATLCDTSHTH